ncbi:hypothetical protein CEE39_00500 [bacterium (candidate division B38) B3_B38]|nr:MAG: hypothetical protein CEE39_00500 [bacterium (candidate division B38) B3_B38]
MEAQERKKSSLKFHGGLGGALFPFLIVVGGALYLGIARVPDIYGYWPTVAFALVAGMLLAKNRYRYTEVLIEGMSQPIVMIMVGAWLFASVIGNLMYETGLVEALIWVCLKIGLTGRLFTGATFIIACLIGTSTGTSVGTIITCTPILYPAGYLLGAHPVALMGAILGGGAFGDNLSPISDTTIASAFTQRTDIGGVVKSRLKYAFPAGGIALILYIIFGQGSTAIQEVDAIAQTASPRGLPMLLVPVLIVILCLKGRHLLEALFWGMLTGCLTGILFGLITFKDLFRLEREAGTAQGIILEGMKGGVGISIFTILLIGLVYSLQAAGVTGRLISWAERVISSARQAEFVMMLSTMFTNLIMIQNTVTIVSVGEFARQTGERFQIHPNRRANILDVAANVFQHIVPYMVTVLLASAYSHYGEKYGAAKLTPIAIGLHNYHSWMLLAVLTFAVLSGYGQKFLKDDR